MQTRWNIIHLALSWPPDESRKSKPKKQIRSNEITFQIIIFRVTDILNPIATGIYYYQTAYYRYGLHYYYDVVHHSTVPDAFFHVCLACMESIRFFISHTARFVQILDLRIDNVVRSWLCFVPPLLVPWQGQVSLCNCLNIYILRWSTRSASYLWSTAV